MSKKNNKKNTSTKKKTSKKSEKNKKKNILNIENIMKTTFILLLILVIVLTILVIKKVKKENETIKANIVISVCEEKKDYELSINLAELAKRKEYIIKVTNYRNNKINKKKIKYKINVENSTKTIINVTKNNDKNNLMNKQESSIIEDNKLSKSEKEEIYYRFTIKSPNKKINKDDKINVKITS